MRLEINHKEKKNSKKHKHMEAKQYATKQSMGHLKISQYIWRQIKMET